MPFTTAPESPSWLPLKTLGHPTLPLGLLLPWLQAHYSTCMRCALDQRPMGHWTSGVLRFRWPMAGGIVMDRSHLVSTSLSMSSSESSVCRSSPGYVNATTGDSYTILSRDATVPAAGHWVTCFAKIAPFHQGSSSSLPSGTGLHMSRAAISCAHGRMSASALQKAMSHP